MTAEDRFGITERPRRHFPAAGGLEYEGGTVFHLEPTASPGNDALADDALADVVLAVLDADRYRYGDFHDLPMQLWLVRDEDTGDAFRVAVRDGAVRLHVLPRTEPAGLRRFHDRLEGATDVSWTVTRSSPPE